LKPTGEFEKSAVVMKANSTLRKFLVIWITKLPENLCVADKSCIYLNIIKNMDHSDFFNMSQSLIHRYMAYEKNESNDGRTSRNLQGSLINAHLL
jgi:hypothetical protein